MLLATLLFLLADNPELEALRKVDQSDRHFVSSPQEIDWHKIGVRDQARQQRVRELLLSDQVHTARDFDNAALIMQHGSKPADYLLAHELAAIAAYKGNFGSLPALAQDRWLDSIGKQQRWGSQFDWEGNVKPLQSKGACVTDQMRRDLLLPTLEEIQTHGVNAPMANIKEKVAYIEKRMDATQWTHTFHSRPNLKSALKAVAEQRINTSRDYAYAAEAILKSSKTDELLLSHELALIAMARKHPDGPRLFAASLDAYLSAIGQQKRYAGGRVAPGVARALVGEKR